MDIPVSAKAEITATIDQAKAAYRVGMLLIDKGIRPTASSQRAYLAVARSLEDWLSALRAAKSVPFSSSDKKRLIGELSEQVNRYQDWLGKLNLLPADSVSRDVAIDLLSVSILEQMASTLLSMVPGEVYAGMASEMEKLAGDFSRLSRARSGYKLTGLAISQQLTAGAARAREAYQKLIVADASQAVVQEAVDTGLVPDQPPLWMTPVFPLAVGAIALFLIWRK